MLFSLTKPGPAGMPTTLHRCWAGGRVGHGGEEKMIFLDFLDMHLMIVDINNQYFVRISQYFVKIHQY